MHDKIFVFMPIINFVVICFGIRKIIPLGIIDSVGYAITLTLFEILLFKKWLWKLNIVKKITGIENIQGEWKGSIYSNFDNQEHVIEKVIIKQSFNKYKVVFETKESKSISEVNRIKINEFDRLELEYLYKNEAPVNLRQRNPMHFGVAKLELKNNELVGTYWTDREIKNGRNTRGIIVFKNQNKKGKYDLISLTELFDLF